MAQLKSLAVLALLVAAMAVVCPAQVFQTDSTNSAATVLNVTGQVSVLRDSSPWALNTGSQVKPQEIVITGSDGHAEFKCSDGSTFEVFPNSRVTFRNHPGDWKDLLEMWLGKVRVHIEKLNGLPNRNRVRTPTAIISVRGTIFDVEIQEEDTTFVLVEEGQVAVAHVTFGGEPRLLNPNEWIRVYKNVPLAQKMIDKGSIIRATMHAAADAIYTAIYNTPKSSGGSVPGGNSGGGLPGDHSSKDPPPTPPSSGGGNSGGGSNTGGSSGGGTAPTPPPPSQ